MEIQDKRSSFLDQGADLIQLLIILKESEPLVWRRIQVPIDYTFFDLHVAIQDAMGWTDSHLHLFTVPHWAGAELRVSIPMPSADWEEGVVDGSTLRIVDHLDSSHGHWSYDYDFGDNWNHSILFERLEFATPGVAYPRCVDGASACPPEDCGGVEEYKELQGALRQPKHPRYDEFTDWLELTDGRSFDPTSFDPGAVRFQDPNKRLAEYREHQL